MTAVDIQALVVAIFAIAALLFLVLIFARLRAGTHRPRCTGSPALRHRLDVDVTLGQGASRQGPLDPGTISRGAG